MMTMNMRDDNEFDNDDDERRGEGGCEGVGGRQPLEIRATHDDLCWKKQIYRPLHSTTNHQRLD